MFTNKHRFFVQFMLANGCVTKENALKFFDEISPDENSLAHLKTLIKEINREIGEHFFKIAFAICEVTCEEVFVWLNTKNDPLTRHQLEFSAVELEYFHVLMQEIVTSEDHSILYPQAVNIASTLTATLSRENGEKALIRWFQAGYFVKKEGNIYLGPRTILEFTTFLKTNTENCNCKLCSELVFLGETCNSCNETFHSYCIQKYLQRQDTCPNCTTAWENAAVASAMEEDSQADSINYSQEVE